MIDAGKDYLFRIKNELWLLVQGDAQRLLGTLPKEQALAHTEDVLTNATGVRRHMFLHPVKMLTSWMLPGMKTVIRVARGRSQRAEEEKRC